MALSQGLQKRIVIMLTSEKAGADFTNAVNNHAAMQTQTFERLVDALGSRPAAQALSAAILATGPVNAGVAKRVLIAVASQTSGNELLAAISGADSNVKL